MKKIKLKKYLLIGGLTLFLLPTSGMIIATTVTSCSATKQINDDVEAIIKQDINNNFSSDYINQNYIDNLLVHLNRIGAISSINLDVSSSLALNDQNEPYLEITIINNNLDLKIINIDLSNYIQVSGSDNHFNLNYYLSSILKNIKKPEDINESTKELIADTLKIDVNCFDVEYYPVVSGDYKTNLPANMRICQLYDLKLIMHNEYIIENNKIINKYYECENLATGIAFPVIEEHEFLDINEFKNVMKWMTNDDFFWVCKNWGQAYFTEWFQSLSNKNFDLSLDNLYCETEMQALSLYANCWGDFWNVELHKNQEPTDKTIKVSGQIAGNKIMKIRGSDYQYICEALKRATMPQNVIAYHGVEFMEDEFYEQLQEYIKQDSKGNYDYSDCIGKTITSYGFISTTFTKKHAADFVDGEDWVNGGYHLPLKTPTLFKIKIPKNTPRCAYISGFKMSNGSTNTEQQILIDRSMNYRIDNIEYEIYNNKKITIFDLTVLS